MVTRGGVYWCDFPDEGRRPALILTRPEAVPVLNRVLVAPITRTIRGIPTEVRFDEADGMPAECVATFDNVRQIPHAYLGELITTLSGSRMHDVCKALAIATGCD
jgi:mRNA interferase MazF